MELALVQSSYDLAQALGVATNENLTRAATIEFVRDLTAGVTARAIDGDR